MDLAKIAEAIQAGRVRVTDHADEEAAADRLSLDDVFFATLCGEVIEDYPTDFPYPSCLVYGRDRNDGPVHAVWAYSEATSWAVLITVYRPDPARWIDGRRRRKRS